MDTEVNTSGSRWQYFKLVLFSEFYDCDRCLRAVQNDTCKLTTALQDNKT